LKNKKHNEYPETAFSGFDPSNLKETRTVGMQVRYSTELYK